MLHLQNFDIIRIVIPQGAEVEHHTGKNCLDAVLFIAGCGEEETVQAVLAGMMVTLLSLQEDYPDFIEVLEV